MALIKEYKEKGQLFSLPVPFFTGLLMDTHFLHFYPTSKDIELQGSPKSALQKNLSVECRPRKILLLYKSLSMQIKLIT